MTISTVPLGSQIAEELPDTAETCIYTAEKLAFLQDLLDALQANPPEGYSMLRSTASKLAEFYELSPDKIQLDSMAEDRETFRDYLKEHRYAQNSVRSYTNYMNILVSKAKELGWRPSPPVIPAPWTPLLAAIASAGCEKLLRHLVKNGLLPATVQESDLSHWVGLEVKRGASYDKTTGRAGLMRRIVVQAGFTTNLAVNKVRKDDYGVPLEMFPETLRIQVKDVLQWKQSKWEPTRPKNAQVRAVTALNIRNAFCRLYGFTVNIDEKTTITSLRELVTEENIGRFISWCLNERQVKNKGLSIFLGSICAALSRNPKYADITIPWMPDLLSRIPEDSGEDAIQRKEEKYIPYTVLAGIPELIRRERSTIPQDDKKAIALSVRDELLIKWLVNLPWRQRNLREFRIGGQSPNLFRALLPNLTSVIKPEWLQEQEQQRGPFEVWQVRFNTDETKTHHNVHCVLPQRLILLLEEYLNDHRPSLILGGDPGTLFVNDHGRAMTPHTLRNAVSRITLKYGGKVVTPHLFRDIFAYMWLDLAPEDYLTLSLLLWHRDIQTTIQIYGRKFNHSAALCRMERLLPG